MKPAWEAACDYRDESNGWLNEESVRRLSRLLESYERHGRRSRDAEIAALRRERDEAVRLLREFVEAQAECFGNATRLHLRLITPGERARAFLAKTEEEAS